MQQLAAGWAAPFALIYLTFFLDNVLLTVLVPIIPGWVRGAAVNGTGREDAAPGSQALVGLVLSAKALAQLAAAGPAAAAVCRLGPAAPLRAGTALLLLAALGLAGASARGGRGGAAGAGLARAAQGAGAALSGVAGLALAQAALPPTRRGPALGALLGAVALGVLVGYPFGGAAYALRRPETPFLIIAAAILLTLVLQYRFLWREEYNQPLAARAGDVWAAARAAPRGAAAGAVLLSTSVMAALEPTLPLWLQQRFHPQKWVTGAVFVPDSAAYALAASTLGGAARVLGAERTALAGQLLVGLAALALPHASSVLALAGPHVALGAGLGAVDAALVPALLARRPAAAPHTAALLHGAASAAYVLGPVVGGLVAWGCGFATTMRLLGVLNLLYAAHLYRALRAHPLSEQWGASACSDDEEEESVQLGEVAPLRARAGAQ